MTDIFEEPQFYIDGPTSNDVRQGRSGDCWLLAALCTLSVKPGLIEKLCVARDEAVGVYGFVFFRDGEWISEIVDDFVSIYLFLGQAMLGLSGDGESVLTEDLVVPDQA